MRERDIRDIRVTKTQNRIQWNDETFKNKNI